VSRLRRTLAGIALAALAGCSDPGGAARAGPEPAAAGTTTSTTTAPPVLGASTTTTRSRGPVTTARVGELAPTSLAPTSTSERPPAGPPGAAAARFLRGSTPLRLQVLVQEGASIRAGTVDHLLAVFRSVSSRPISVAQSALASDRRTWSDDEVRIAGRGPADLRMLLLRGASATGDDVLGVTVQEDVVAVFPDRVRDASGPLIGGAALERAVTTHELGHVLGLVDLVLATGRADPDHPGHSRNPGSVMYWAIESDLVGSVLTGGPPTEFDADDRADLQRIRAG
jgi:hypothetical protein